MTDEFPVKLGRLLRWQSGGTPGPFGISLYPTNRCNQRCKTCWQRQFEELDYTEVPDDRLLRLVDEAAELEVREWTISGGGEPLTRGDLVMAVCERVVERGMYGRLHTNATLLAPERLEHLVRIGWRWINVSLDGPTAEINDGIRSKGAFERATANIRRLAELRRKHGTDKPIVTLNPVITCATYDKIDQMVRLAHELECRGGIFISSLIIHDDSSAAFRLTEPQRAELPTHMDRAMAVAHDLGVRNNIESIRPVEDGNPLRGPDGEVWKPIGDGRLSDALCFEAWLSVAIAADGKVGPCCVFYDEAAESIQDMSLKDAWLGAYLEGVREALLFRRGLPHYCKSCHSAIAPRAKDLRQALLTRERTRWTEMGLAARARFLASRFAANVRHRGLQRAFQRALEWIQLHVPR